MNPTFLIIFILLIAQYLIALVALAKLAHLGFGTKKYILLNLLIVFVFFVGSAVFLIKYNKQIKAKKQELFAPKKQYDDTVSTKATSIDIDVITNPNDRYSDMSMQSTVTNIEVNTVIKDTTNNNQ